MARLYFLRKWVKKMKTNLLLFFLVFFIILAFPIRASAEEITSYGVDILQTNHTYKSNGAYQTGYPNVEILGQFDSFSPIYVYYYQSADAPVSQDIIQYYIISLYKFDENCAEFMSNSNTWYYYSHYSLKDYAYPFSGYRDLQISGDNVYRLNKSYGSNDFITAFQNGTLDYNVIIDWDNAVYNETIGYLQNVGLKISGVGNKDFTITWSTSNNEYLSNEWLIQIGWQTTFQESLFGDQKAYTNLELVNWEDNLQYSAGRVEFNLGDLWAMIPDGYSFSHNGYFLLRIIHVDISTGLIEYGGWGQIQWTLSEDGVDVVKFTPISSSTILEHSGVTENYDIEFIEDTSTDTGSYYINSANGSVDTVSTDFSNTLQEVDWSTAGNLFYNGLISIISTLGNFPSLVSKIVSFLPTEIITLLGISIVMVIILRVGGR